MKKAALYFLILPFLGLVFSGCSSDSAKQATDNNSINQLVTYPLPGTTDSLLSLLKILPDDSNKVNVLNELSWELKNNNPDTAVILSMQALSIAEKLSASTSEEIAKGGKKGIASSCGNLGAFNYLMGDYEQALDFYFKALKIDEELKNTGRVASHFGNIGIVYRNQADFAKALEYYLKALKLDEALSKSVDEATARSGKKGMATRLGNIGIVYDEQSDYPKALDYYLKALKLDEELNNQRGIANRLGNIGVAYYNQGELARANSDTALASGLYRKALDYYFKALKTDEELENKNRIAYDCGNIGNVYHKQGDLSAERGDETQAGRDYSIALSYYKKAEELAGELGNKNGIAVHLGNMGSLYISMEKYQDAFTNLYHSLALSDSIGAQDLVRYNYEQLSTLYKKSGTPLQDSIGGKHLNIEEMRLRALHYYKKFISVRDTLFSEENNKQLVQKEMNFEFEKKEAATKAEHDKKDALAKEELEQKEQQRNYFIIGFALVALLAVFIFRGYRQKQKANEIISEQKLLVEEKQKEVLDSIHYARRIQRSLLPTEKYIERNLKRLMKNK